MQDNNLITTPLLLLTNLQPNKMDVLRAELTLTLNKLLCDLLSILCLQESTNCRFYIIVCALTELGFLWLGLTELKVTKLG